jgi:hypothetical protein
MCFGEVVAMFFTVRKTTTLGAFYFCFYFVQSCLFIHHNTMASATLSVRFRCWFKLLMVTVVPVLSLIRHQDVKLEIEGDSRTYSMCLHVELNGEPKWLTLTSGQFNNTEVALALLSQDNDKALRNDKVAIQSVSGYVDTRVTSMVGPVTFIFPAIQGLYLKAQFFVLLFCCFVSIVNVLVFIGTDET